MKYLILASLFLIGCGGGSSTIPVQETITETIVEQVPIIERECAEPETIYVYVEQNTTEPTNTVEIVTYFQEATHTVNGVSLTDKTYTDDGYLLTDYSERTDRLLTYTYNDNNDILSEVVEVNGTIESYRYLTYDENYNLLTQDISNGYKDLRIYDEQNRVIRYEVTYSTGGTDIIEYTYIDNTITQTFLSRDRTIYEVYDVNDNLIYKETVSSGVTTIETWTWKEFTEEIR